ncbi:MAG TPA: anhydro-N-acetylmuramic acid kinase [Gemmatimonadaceae bacterium]|nr:anhydro-N-acetylmuramic acid kinase [Gemmatimonadaceae bacterium]
MAPGASSGAAAGVYIGLMSGTSLDGISAAAARFADAPAGGVAAELLAFAHVAYDAEKRDRMLAAMAGASPREYCRLAVDFGGWLAEAAELVMRSASLAPSEVRAIASHGQTLWHEPGHSTWQIGEPAVIAERTGVPVIANFRARDVAAGGQGAPLVPIADALLFSAPDAWRALQNLGGIGNVTIVPPGGATGGLRAFDTGPGVAVVDAVTRRLAPELPYDTDGALASRGRVIEAAVEWALADPYFAAPPPKSTGRELFGGEYAERFIARCRTSAPDASTEDCVVSAVALTARAIGDAFRRFVVEPVRELVLSGGGARNPALVRAIVDAMPGVTVRRFDELFFDGEAKEAVAFALMGFLHVAGRPGNVPEATGARGLRILGQWVPA